MYAVAFFVDNERDCRDDVVYHGVFDTRDAASKWLIEHGGDDYIMAEIIEIKEIT